MLLVWSSGTWGQPVLPGRHFVPVLAAGMIGCFPEYQVVWPGGPMGRFQSGKTRDGPGGRVSLPDHRQLENV